MKRDQEIPRDRRPKGCSAHPVATGLLTRHLDSRSTPESALQLPVHKGVKTGWTPSMNETLQGLPKGYQKNWLVLG
ncbi:MAG: hypothetical protein NZM65_06795, partial [Flavobacteriales bacterium]|nr:hypothetical protein [Flavobacteriales bacterium]MDW8410380.1 hypothetical protein [Flavobacteriales bacterium]